MKSKIFFDKTEINGQEYKYTDKYIMYLVFDYLSNHDMISVKQFIFLMESYYGKNAFKHSRIDTWLSDKFKAIDKNNYFITDELIYIFPYLKEFKDNYHLSRRQLSLKYGLKLMTDLFDLDICLQQKLVIFYLFYVKSSHFKFDYYCYKLLDVLLNMDEYLVKTDQIITDIDDSYHNLSIDAFIDQDVSNKTLMFSEIYTIKDFRQLSVEDQFLMFSLNIDAMDSFKILHDNFEMTFKDRINDCFSELKENEVNVIKKRYSIEPLEEVTLQSIGNEIGLTRERVRQIEAKAWKKLSEYASKIKYYLINIFLKIDDSQLHYFSLDDAMRYFNNSQLLYKFALICEASDLGFKLDHEYKVFYDEKNISIENIIRNELNVIGSILTREEYLNYDSMKKAIVDKNYNLRTDNTYLDKHTHYSELILNLLDENFPNGYKIGGDDDYKKLKEIFHGIYGQDLEFPSQRAIVAYFYRINNLYCCIGRGLYKRRAYCVQIPESLVEKMIDYILESDNPVVYYISIYHQFKDELELLGIDNLYYMKGLIDPYIEKEFVTKRDYILATPDDITAREAVLMYIRSFDVTFSLQDLRNRFPGVKDHVFLLLLNEEEKNGLITLRSSRYMYIKNTNIDLYTIKDLKQFIEQLFIEIDSNVVSSRKILTKLTINRPDLLQKLAVEDQFALFSVIKYYFKKDFNFQRPFIFKGEATIKSGEQLIMDHVSTMESFNPRIIDQYCDRMNIRNVPSYLEFMEEMSETYVQTSIGTMVRKDKLNLSKDFLNQLDDTLKLILKHTANLNLRYFNGYKLFPKCEYSWNQYLLAGIVRSYFSDKYKVINTSNMYNDTSFIIKCLVKSANLYDVFVE